MRALAVIVTIFALPRLVWTDEIHDAVRARDIARIEQLLAANPELINAGTEDGTTPLHIAVDLNDAGLINMLLRKRVDINASTDMGYTPLHYAARKNAADAARLLIDKNADIKTTKDGFTPLQLAVKENADAVAKLLITGTTSSYEDKFLDSRFKEGERARTTGDLARAYEMFTRLLKKNPGSATINFAYGLTCFSLKDYSRARLAFVRVLQIDPGHNRARLELAYTLMAAEQYEEARTQFELILTQDISSKVRIKVEQYLQHIKRMSKKWNIIGRIDVGAFEDDNVNVGPDSDIINIDPIVLGATTISSLTLLDSSLPVEAQGLFSSVVLSGIFDAGVRGKWCLSTDGAYYQNWLDDEPDHESLYYQAALSVRHVGARSKFQLPVIASHLTYGGEPLIDMYGISPSYLHVTGVRKEWHWLTGAVVELRDWDKLDDRDGMYIEAGETLRWHFGALRHSVLIGVSVFYDDTDEKVYEYTGFSCQVGGAIQLPWSTELYVKANYRIEDYEEKEVLAPEKRSDTQLQYIAGLNKMIMSWWGVDVNYQNIDNDSTFGLYEYDRNITTVSTFLAF